MTKGMPLIAVWGVFAEKKFLTINHLIFRTNLTKKALEFFVTDAG
jgi:hypothetical protein